MPSLQNEQFSTHVKIVGFMTFQPSFPIVFFFHFYFFMLILKKNMIPHCLGLITVV